MPFKLTLTQFFYSFLAVAQARTLDLGQRNARHHGRAELETIQWAPCDLGGALPTFCGTLSVPLDYTDPASDKTLTLELLRIPAAKSPSKGSILFNFGGPGGNSREGLALLGALLQPISGGHHDLVTFNTRGTGNSLRFSCYDDNSERVLEQVTMATISANASDAALGTIWGRGKIFGQRCLAAQNETGSFLGTAFVARDMMQVVDALGEDGLLRYWGFSYGTVLGATAAAMFPDRMDKVVLDGVVNPHEYYHGYEVELLTDADKTFTAILSHCITSPGICPLGRNRTVTDLEQTIYSFLDDLKYNPIPIYTPEYSYLLEYPALKSYIFYTLKAPDTFPAFAAVLDGLLTGNMTPVTEFVGTYLAKPPEVVDGESLEGIKCSDMFDRAPRKEDIQPALKARYGLSRLGDIADYLVARCAQWPMAAKERYDGDFRVRTRSPVLVIGNTWDPVTPLASARNVSAGFEGSVLLEHNGLGHSTLTQGSLCTAKAIAGYFLNGSLPDPGTVCATDGSPFFSGWDKVIPQLMDGE